MKVLLAGGKIPFFQTAGGVADFAFCSDGKGRVHLSGNGTDPSLKNGTDDRGLDYQDSLKALLYRERAVSVTG